MSNGRSFYGELPESGTTLTTGEYLKTAESVRVQELIYGTLRLEDSPTPQHQMLVFRIARMLDDYVRLHRIGSIWIAPLDIILDSARGLVMQPDLFFISNARSDIIADHIWGAPDLVVEVVSPHPRIGKLDERIKLFAAHGVRECWVVHQLLRRLEILQLQNGGVTAKRTFEPHEHVTSPVLPFTTLTLEALTGWPSDWSKKDAP